MGSHKRRKGSPYCANERLCNARQRDSKTDSLVDLPLFAPKIPKIVDKKIPFTETFEHFAVFPIVNNDTVYMCTMVPKIGYFNKKII